MNHGSAKLRKLADGQVALEKMYSTDGPIGGLRFSQTSKLRHVSNKHEARSTPELAVGQGGGAVKHVSDKPKADRKRVLEELGAVLAGQKVKMKKD